MERLSRAGQVLLLWRIAAPSDPLCLTKERKVGLVHICYYCVLTLQFVQVNYPKIDRWLCGSSTGLWVSCSGPIVRFRTTSTAFLNISYIRYEYNGYEMFFSVFD